MTRYVVTAGGVRLAYEASGTGEPAMLFVHGWCCDRSYFEPQSRRFAAGHRVAALDLRGHGASDRPEPGHGNYDIETLADDALTVARDAGFALPVMVGHSMGGLVALACAARPGAVRAAVLVDPAPVLDERGRSYFARSVADVAADEDGSWRGRFAARLLLPTDTARRQDIVTGGAAVPAPVAAAAMRGMAEFDGAGTLDRVRVPVLSIHARRPEVGLREHPAVTIGQTVGAGHFPQLEVPDQVNAMIERFLAIRR